MRNTVVLPDRRVYDLASFLVKLPEFCSCGLAIKGACKQLYTLAPDKYADKYIQQTEIAFGHHPWWNSESNLKNNKLRSKALKFMAEMVK